MDHKDQTKSFIEQLLSTEVPQLTEKILADPQKDLILNKVTCLQKQLELHQILNKSDEDVIVWIDDCFKVVNQHYKEEEQNKNQLHELNLELSHKLFQNEQAFKIKIVETVKPDETFNGSYEMELADKQFHYVLKYDSQTEISPKISLDQAMCVLELMGLDKLLTKERAGKIAKGLKLKLQDSIISQLPLCENNELYDDDDDDDNDDEEGLQGEDEQDQVD